MQAALALFWFTILTSVPLALDHQLLSPDIVAAPLLICFFFALAQIAVLLTHSRPSIGALLIWSFVAWNFCLPGIAQMRYGFPWNFQQQPDHVLFTSGLLLLVFCAAFFLSHLAMRFNNVHMTSCNYRKCTPPRISVPLICVVAIPAAGLGAVITLRHGINVFIQPREQFDAYIGMTYPGLQSYAFMLLAGVVFVAFLYSVLAMYHVYRHRMYVQAACLFLLTITLGIINAFLNHPYHLPRFIALGYAFMLIAIFLFPIRLLLFKAFVIMYPVGSYIVSPAVNFVTRRAGHEFADLRSFRFDANQSLLSGDFGDLQMTMMAIHYVQQEGVQLGKTLLSAMLFFVPRNVWAGKGTSGGTEIALYEGHPYTNISVPLFVEMYMDFWFIGTVGVAIALAWLVSRTFCLEMIGSPYTHRYFSAAAFVGFMPILMRGSLLAVIAPITAVLIVPLALGGMQRLGLIKRRFPQRAREARRSPCLAGQGMEERG